MVNSFPDKINALCVFGSVLQLKGHLVPNSQFGRNLPFSDWSTLWVRRYRYMRPVRSFSFSSLLRCVWGSKKKHRDVPIKKTAMGDSANEQVLAPLRASVKEQGDLVRKLKSEGASEIDVKKAVAELKLRKKALDDRELTLSPQVSFDRAKMEDVLKRRFFFDQSFAIYGGITGQFDYGPMGCALKTNLLNHWRSFFVIEENMSEVECSILTPEPVLKASGHVERFADLMVKDVKTGECFRLDHIIKASLEKLAGSKGTAQDVKEKIADILVKLDGMTKEEMSDVLTDFKIKSPLTGNDLTEPIDFNLMFSTQIGPTGLVKGFLRPETAQGIFVNFKRLLEFNQGRLPFAAAQIGNAFRNEISPRSGLLRVREFTLAEIEHFCDPSDKSHPNFDAVAESELMLYSACDQMDGKPAKNVKIGDAVKTGLVNNETLGYYMARIHAYLLNVGIDKERLRFRQHMNQEMAHYACDCWDAEALTSYGWVECVGCADRSAYDLTQHTKATGVRLSAEKKLPEPKTVTVTEAQVNKGIVGKVFKKDAKAVSEALVNASSDVLNTMEDALSTTGSYDLTVDGEVRRITRDMASLKVYEKTMHVEEFTPSVVEPAFGIGRILYALLEHTFAVRESDEQRTYFKIPASVAPLKCAVFPLSSNAEFQPFIRQLASALKVKNVSHKVDDSGGSIGRRYARTDEIAVPYGVTIDFDTVKDSTVTLRERDSMSQVRIPLNEVPAVVQGLSLGETSWPEVQGKYPKFEQQESTKEK
ncbi:glycine--tRNA ligase [Cimex lectularius]|uniref:Glycine--tRNA ligase n=1 Tax=Cimex lectularius TaxID=79782 RepID=A0A8I6SB58_CIMLE|nr:glycine--tRNA ligase [Cimex lectularius]